jgi:enoyl-CoA hydratase
MTYEDIKYEIDGRLAYVTLNRPEKLNALSNNLRGEMIHAMKEAEATPEVAVIVLRSAGRAFSAGYDLTPSRAATEASPYVHPRSLLPDTGTTNPGPMEWSRHVVATNWQIWELSKPVIAQVHGYCLAGGTELASICDFRIVAEDAQIGYPPVRAMTTMDMMWAPWHLPMAKAREFAYIGDSITGAEMARLGWANYAVPAEDLAGFVQEFATRMGHIDNDMLMYSKRAVNRQYEVMGIRTGLWSGTEIQGLSSYRPAAGEFGRRSQKDGLKAALEWRDGPFHDFRGAYDSAPKTRSLAGSEDSEGDDPNTRRDPRSGYGR